MFTQTPLSPRGFLKPLSAHVTRATFLILASGFAPVRAQEPSVTCRELARSLFGVAGTAADGACVITVARTGASLTLMGAIMPAAALDSRFVFPGDGDTGVVFADIALPAAQRAQFVAGAVAAGAEVTSVHRHMSGEQPQLVAVHLRWTGEYRPIASGLRQLLGPPASPPAGPAATGLAGVVAGVPCVRLAMTVHVADTAAVRGPGSCALELPGDTTRIGVGGSSSAVGLLLGSRVLLSETSAHTDAVLSATLTIAAPAAPATFDALTKAGLDVVAWHTAVLGEVPPMARLHVQGQGNPLLMLESVQAALEAAQKMGGSSGSGGPSSLMR